jgi:hypothetical protein
LDVAYAVQITATAKRCPSLHSGACCPL